MKVVLLTSGQPALNPRLVKEADALTDAGYEVTVIYQFWNQWGTNLDVELLAKKKWKYLKVGGDPVQAPIRYWTSRLVHKFMNYLVKITRFENGIAELALGRCTAQLINQAKKTPADLYIAHNLAAIPAAVAGSKKNGSKCGFDAEDLHRYEMSDDEDSFEVRLKKYIETKYFPQVNYLSTSSPQIAEKYESLFPKLKFEVILNLFNNENFIPNLALNRSGSLKLFWFSQSVGLSRGLQDVIEAMKILENKSIELSIVGNLTKPVAEEFERLIDSLNFSNAPKITYHEPMAEKELNKFAANFNIGLATEPGFSINNDLALSNKIFTYIQAGLAVIASDTTAQKGLLEKYDDIGFIYEKEKALTLAAALMKYLDDQDLLKQHQLNSKKYALETLNWNVEKERFLTLVHQTLAASN